MIVDLSASTAQECVAVVRSLPEWFGYEGALEDVDGVVRSQRGFVALAGAKVAGFVTVMPVFDETVEITYLAVHADHRRSGFGRALVMAVRDQAVEVGASSICLLTLGPSAQSSHYDETVAFYRSLGFWRTKELYLSVWGGAPTLVMSAPLNQIA